MEEAPRLTPGAVAAIWELPDGPATYKPVLQVASLRLVTAKKSAVSEVAAASGQQHKAEEFRMLLSDGVYSQQSVLATALNHLVTDGALRLGSIVQLQDITCNNFQGCRILIVVKLDVLQSECAKIRTPKIYDKTLPGGQEVNLPPDTAQANNGKYSGDPGMLGSAVATRVQQRANNMSYGGPYNGVHGTVDSSSCQTVQPGPNNVLSGGSYGTMSAQNTMKANVVQPHSQQPLLNSHSAVPPPSNYGAQTIPMLHIYNLGPPPMLDATNFIRWKFLMESHISASSIQLWRIIKDGFKLFDSRNLSPKEKVDQQLNAIALDIIVQSLTSENLAHISPFLSAKEAWDHLNNLFTGNSSIQLSKLYVILDEADEFVMNEDESPHELYGRLKSLAVALKDHGSKDVDDNWIKRKFLKAIMPFEKNMSYMIRQRSDFHTLSSINVLHEFISMGIFNKHVENVLAHARGVRKQPNLALKAKLVQEDLKEECRLEEIKYAFHEYMTLALIKYWSNWRSFKSKNSSGFMPKQHVRTCYNCCNDGHFADECPYEKRQDNGGKLIRKDKPKFLQNNSSGFKPKHLVKNCFSCKHLVKNCFNCFNVGHFIEECPYEKREDNGGKLIRKELSATIF